MGVRIQRHTDVYRAASVQSSWLVQYRKRGGVFGNIRHALRNLKYASHDENRSKRKTREEAT